MAAHCHHQIFLENVLDFSPRSPLTADELGQAVRIFNQLLKHCEPLQKNNPYKRTTLVRLMYEHSRSKEIFLQHFFVYLGTSTRSKDQPPSSFSEGLSLFSGFDPTTSTDDKKKDAERIISSFAEYIFDNLFLPLKASGQKTPQVTPAASSAPALETVTGTPARLSTLRRDCLIRDHHRCVATRAFDRVEARKRSKRDGTSSQDDEGLLFLHSRDSIAHLEVAHIIPHSFTSLGGEQQLTPSKKAALAILNMFDPGVIHLIEGPNIDRPSNAITLTRESHSLFVNFEIHFEPTDPTVYPPHTYKIDSTETNSWLFPSWLPVTRTLYLSPNHMIDPPSPRLLGIHWACAVMLHLSGAGEYIDEILHDMEDTSVQSDGSAQLGHIVSLKLGGWFDGVAA